MTALRLPAYAKPLADVRRRGMTLRHPLVSVRLHGLRRPVIGYGVCVPEDLEPGDCDWTWIRGLDVFVVRHGDSAQRVMAAAKAIERCRPRRLIVLDLGDCTVVSLLAPEDVERAVA